MYDMINIKFGEYLICFQEYTNKINDDYLSKTVYEVEKFEVYIFRGEENVTLEIYEKEGNNWEFRECPFSLTNYDRLYITPEEFSYLLCLLRKEGDFDEQTDSIESSDS